MKGGFEQVQRACIVLALVLFVCGCGGKEAPARQRPDEPVPVRVETVKLQDIQKTLDYVGNIKAEDEAVVYPKVSGKVIRKLKRDGEPVAKSEPIILIDRDEVGLKYEKSPVESPLDGVIGRIYVDIGQNVTSQTPVALVVDMRSVKVSLDVPEVYLPYVAEGQNAAIYTDAYPKDKFDGIITKLSPVVDLATRAAPVEITIDNKDSRLKSGMFAKVSLVIESHKDVPAVLKEAVIGKEPDAYVYVIEDNKSVLRKIALGLRQGPYVEALDGIKQGERVVIVGQQRLKDGSAVTVEAE